MGVHTARNRAKQGHLNHVEPAIQRHKENVADLQRSGASKIGSIMAAGTTCESSKHCSSSRQTPHTRAAHNSKPSSSSLPPTRRSSRFQGTQAHLATHPAVVGANGEALRAWPVYATYYDRGRRHHVNSPSFMSTGLTDCGHVPVRHSRHHGLRTELPVCCMTP